MASDSGKVAFSPGKVYDLRVTRIQFPEVTLGWTAPGHQEDANIGENALRRSEVLFDESSRLDSYQLFVELFFE